MKTVIAIIALGITFNSGYMLAAYGRRVPRPKQIRIEPPRPPRPIRITRYV